MVGGSLTKFILLAGPWQGGASKGNRRSGARIGRMIGVAIMFLRSRLRAQDLDLNNQQFRNIPMRLIWKSPGLCYSQAPSLLWEAAVALGAGSRLNRNLWELHKRPSRPCTFTYTNIYTCVYIQIYKCMTCIYSRHRPRGGLPLMFCF